jgi:hypothetical protein
LVYDPEKLWGKHTVNLTKSKFKTGLDMNKSMVTGKWFLHSNDVPHLRQLNMRIVIYNVICLAFILLFAYAATSKLLDYEDFSAQLHQSPFINEFAELTAIAVPVGELLICLGRITINFRNSIAYP